MENVADIEQVRALRTAFEVAGAYGSLDGKVVAITGCSSGLGLQCALAVARAGATVVMICRSGKKADSAAARIREESQSGEIHQIHCDLGKLDSIKQAAQAFDELKLPLHALVNNAGCAGIPTWGKLTEGIESHFAINYLAQFSLAALLHKHLKSTKGARIVNLASESHRRVRKLDAFEMIVPPRKESYNELHAYAFSNLCRILWTRELAKRVEYPVVCLHPAVVASGSSMMQHASIWVLLKQVFTMLWWEWRPFSNPMQSPQCGARTQTWAAVAPLTEIERLQLNGKYLNGNNSRNLYSASAVSSLAAQTDIDERLFEWTMKHTGLEGTY